MFVSHKLKLIHVHIPKTGGNSVNSWMKELDPAARRLGSRPHEPVSKITKEHQYEFQNYRSVAVVRNPWARAVSLYHFRKKRSTAQPPHWPDRESIDTLSFREVVLNSLTQSPSYMEVCPPRDAPETAWLEPSCFAWISLRGEVAVDHVLRLETIESDIASFSAIMGCAPPPFPHLNQTDHLHYSKYYDDETKEIVAERYKQDITNFGYAFGS